MENLSDSLAKEFLLKQKNLLGEDFKNYINAINGDYVRGVRVNTDKISVSEFKSNFEFELEDIPYSLDGFILKTDEKLGNSYKHLAGLFYMQEPSSMVAVCASNIDKETRPLKVLDLCASPGGKTGQIACRVSADSLVVSNEIVKSRADVLYSNIERQGFKNVIVTNEEPKNLLAFENFFDYVFVDAPCSGEGMFRKNPETIAEWSEDNVKMCASRQKEILEVAEKLVVPGGKLIYSTCTFSLEEDEEIVEFLVNEKNFELLDVSKEIKDVTISSCAKVNGADFARKFLPHTGKGEGQFIAVLKKPDGEAGLKLYTKKHFSSIEKARGKEKDLFKDFVSQNFTKNIEGELYRVGSTLFLVPKMFDLNMATALDSLKFNLLGVKLGTLEKDRFEPNQHLFMAFSDIFKYKIELSETELKKYLHGEELASSKNAKGYGVVTFNGYAIGGVKLANNRLKNLYPRGLRI